MVLQCFVLRREVDCDHEEDQNCDGDVDHAEVVDAEEFHAHEFILRRGLCLSDWLLLLFL